MKRYRCKHDIIYDILSSLNQYSGIRITSISMEANIPVDRAKKILDYMENVGLIYKIKKISGERYHITERGYVYMEIYMKLKECLPETHNL